MAAPAQSWTFGAAGVDTSAWNGTGQVAVTVTAGSALLVNFTGQAYSGLNGPLPGWATGQPS